MDRKEIIRFESMKLFCKHGYNGVSMTEILEASGIKKGGFYYHYESKEALFEDALNTYYFDRVENLYQDFMLKKESGVKEQLRTLFMVPHDYLQWWEQQELGDLNGMFLIYFEGTRLFPRIFKNLLEVYYGIIGEVKSLIELGKQQKIIRSDTDSYTVVLFLIAAIEGMLLEISGLSQIDKEHLLERLSDMFDMLWRGMSVEDH